VETLERIIDSVHELHQATVVFGEAVAVRDANKLRSETFGPIHWDNVKAASAFSRYETLLEYLVARSTTESVNPDRIQLIQVAL
jgi:hypothetical protein